MAAKKRGRTPGGKARGGTRSAFGPHLGDAYGIALIVLALLCALGIWFGAVGPVGRGLELIFRGILGVGGLLSPFIFGYLAYAMFTTRPGPERPRISLGVGLTVAGFIGLWHIFKGTPDVTDGAEALRGAGGIVGAIVAGPLARFLSPIGASVVLLAVTGLGLLVVTKTPARVALDNIARWVKMAGSRLGGHIGSAVGTVAERTGEKVEEVRQRRAERSEGTDEDDGGEDDEDSEWSAHDEDPDTVLEAEIASFDPDEEQAELDAAGFVAMSPASPEPEADTIRLPRDLQVAAPIVYDLPSLDLLRRGVSREGSPRTIRATKDTIESVFANFGVEAQVTGHTKGPTVTRYEVELAPGVKVNKVMSLNKDIGYALGTAEIRLLAPIPGKSAIGIEVPNRERELVTLGDILRSEEAQSNDHPMIVGLGKDVGGGSEMVDLRAMPHLLVAGQTGAGKSTCINAIVTSILARATPEEVRLLLIDPKRVELMPYNQVPHLLAPVITNAKRAASALAWVVQEMENRYGDLELNGARNIDMFNEAVRAGKANIHGQAVNQEMSYIVVIVDELADLMMVAARDVEDAICRIAQMARAVGIHLIVATQRPSVDVVTGVIKANIPSRIAFTVASQSDSRVILDQGGAEKLVGKGDMLFLPSSLGKAKRVQGAAVSEAEIESVVRAAKQQLDPDFVDELAEVASGAREIDLRKTGAIGGRDDGGPADEEEALIQRAMELVVSTGLGSTSMLQRKLGMGFAKAGRVMDILEQRGIVGPSIGPKARDVLVSPEELESLRNAGV
ncbi:MAG: DNA translocase FtsK 4TM domain-containing protein [Actinomycetota bacterium]